MRDCLAAIADRSTMDGVDWKTLAILLLVCFVAYVAYDIWRAAHTADTDRRQFDDVKLCELCGADDVSVCPSCAYALREAFRQEDE